MAGSSRWRGNGQLFLLLSMLPSALGCSYAFVHGPPGPGEIAHAEESQAPPPAASCTGSNALPILDTIGAVTFLGAGGLLIVGGASESCTSNCWYASKGQPIGVGVAATALGTLFLASAVTGYGRTSDCRRAQEALPGPPRQSERHLLDLTGIAYARARAERTGR